MRRAAWERVPNLNKVQRISGDRAFLEAEHGTFRCIETEGETSRCTRYEPARYDGEHLHGHRDLP